MVDLLAIKGAIDGLNSARNVAKAAIGLRDAALLQDKVIELNDMILTAQSSALDAQADQLAMAKRIDDLERHIAQVKAWETEKKRYQLTDFGGGTFAYLLKPEMSGGEPAHRICATCYQQGQKSILQFQSKNGYGQDRYHCPACDKDCEFGARSDPFTGRLSSSPRG